MNITIDKPSTLAALQAAETTFLNLSSQLKMADKEEMAKEYEGYAQSIAILREQIRTHGKGANDDGEQQDAA